MVVRSKPTALRILQKMSDRIVARKRLRFSVTAPLDVMYTMAAAHDTSVDGSAEVIRFRRLLHESLAGTAGLLFFREANRRQLDRRSLFLESTSDSHLLYYLFVALFIYLFIYLFHLIHHYSNYVDMADDLFEVGEPQQEGLLSFSVPGDDRPLSFERGAESVASFSEGSALQTSQLRAADAFEVFAGKTYESRVGADVSVSTVAPGGGAPSARRRAHEDPVDRYFRLKAEIDELETDLQALSPSPDGDAPQPANVRPNEIWKQMRLELQAMRSRLARVSDSAAIQPLRAQPAKHGAPEPFVTPTVSSDELLRLVSNLRRRADGGVSPSVLETSTMERPGASLGDSSGTGVTYELYCDPRGRGGDGTCARAERLQMLEGRINRLERSIGSHRNVAAQPNIREALTCLESRIDRLDPAAVAAARKELRPLQAQLSKIIVDQKKQEAAATSAAPLSDSSAVQELFRRTQVRARTWHVGLTSVPFLRFP